MPSKLLEEFHHLRKSIGPLRISRCQTSMSKLRLRRRGTLLSDLIYLWYLEYNWKQKTSRVRNSPSQTRRTWGVTKKRTTLSFLSAYNRYILSTNRLVYFFQSYLRNHWSIKSDNKVTLRLTWQSSLMYSSKRHFSIQKLQKYWQLDLQKLF